MAEQELSLQSQIQGMLKANKDSLEMLVNEKMAGVILETETINQKLDGAISKKQLDEVVKQNKDVKDDVEYIKKVLQDNQPLLDGIAANQERREIEKKSFDERFSEKISVELEQKRKEIEEFQHDRSAKLQFKLDLKTMTLSSVTGSVVTSYGDRQGLVPGQSINLRDLIPTTPSPTGSYVTFRETNTVQLPGIQTEGQAKTDLNYAFTEIKVASNYIAGKVTFSKQLMFALPFMQNTLPRMLIRDFYKKENDYFFIKMAQAATGVNTISGSAVTVDAEEILQMIANQRQANFEASYALVDWREWARVLTTKPNDYSIPGGFIIDSQGTTRIAGTPMVAASWVQSDKVMVFDRDIVERVETESLRVEFSFENNDNFEKNMVTARVECFEEINILRPDGIIYRDLGNS